MSNSLVPLIFKSADACFQSLQAGNPETGTVVLVGNTLMRLEVDRRKEQPVVLKPLNSKSAVHWKSQSLWGRFISLLASFLRPHVAAPVTPSPKHTAAILRKAEYIRRQKTSELRWLCHAGASAKGKRTPDDGGAAPSFDLLRDVVVDRFRPETARALASLRELQARLPAKQADVVASEIIRPIADRFSQAMDRCRKEGMPSATILEAEAAVWKDLKKEAAERHAARRIPASVTNPKDREDMRRAILARVTKAEMRENVPAPEERLKDAAKAMSEIENSRLFERNCRRNDFVKKCALEDPSEIHAYAAMHIYTELMARRPQHQQEIDELFAMVKQSCPANVEAATAELAMQWEAICGVPPHNGWPVRLPKGVTEAMAVLLNGPAYDLQPSLLHGPLRDRAEAIRLAAKTS